MAFLLATKICNSAFFTSLLVSTAVVSVSSYTFQVGGEGGWTKPTGNETETYNGWAEKNRFHVGDSVYFKYQEDSVLVVNYTDYTNCNTSNPISKFEDGDTLFRFDGHGVFYFISGQPDHCQSGQKLIIRVMAQPEVKPPEPAPSPKTDGSAFSPEAAYVSALPPKAGGGNDRSSFNWVPPPSLNSTTKLSIASYFVTALGGVWVILYLFI